MNEIACPFCQVHLPAADLAEGWCDNCGKKLPNFIRSEAARAGIRPARSTAAPAESLSASDERTAGSVAMANGHHRRSRTTITLRGRQEWVTESLPSLCMCCGRAATNSKEKKFGWFPLWIYLLIPIGGCRSGSP
jgi:hypothetical protein